MLHPKKWKLTDEGINRMIDSGFDPEIPKADVQAHFQQQETKHTSTFGRGFKLAFEALMGIFAAWVLIGGIASLIYWAGYHFVIKSCLPIELLSYIPLDNPLVDLVSGFMASTALFLPLRRKNFSSTIAR